MNLVTVPILKIVTADGLCAMGDHVKVGMPYVLDLDRQKCMEWGHMDRASTELRASVFVLAGAKGGDGWMPREFFFED